MGAVCRIYKTNNHNKKKRGASLYSLVQGKVWNAKQIDSFNAFKVKNAMRFYFYQIASMAGGC